MQPMTIYDFEWDYFWQTFESMSWCEIGMLICFAACWPFSILKMLKTGKTTGKSYFFLILMIVGSLLGVGHKLFFDLNVAVLLYAFLAAIIFVDFTICYSIRQREAETARLEARKLQILRRSGALAPGEGAPETFELGERKSSRHSSSRRRSSGGERGASDSSEGSLRSHSHHSHRHSSRSHAHSDDKNENRGGQEGEKSE